MLNKILSIFLFFIGIAIGISADDLYSNNIPNDIISSVVIVNSSTGIVVHSDENKTLILTAYHVIDNQLESPQDIRVEILYQTPSNYFSGFELYQVSSIVYDNTCDLALLEINPDKIFPYAEISEDSVSSILLGDDIWIAANPKSLYRSLKKGIVSAHRIVDNIRMLEVSGGIIYGSSGGGVFDDSGKLIGIISRVKTYKEWTLRIPITYIGFAISLANIKSFLLNSDYSEEFNYLR